MLKENVWTFAWKDNLFLIRRNVWLKNFLNILFKQMGFFPQNCTTESIYMKIASSGISEILDEIYFETLRLVFVDDEERNTRQIFFSKTTISSKSLFKLALERENARSQRAKIYFAVLSSRKKKKKRRERYASS